MKTPHTRRRPYLVDVSWAVGGLGLGAVIGQGLATAPTLHSAASVLTLAGQLFGLVGAYLALVALLLAARLPLLERELGLDRLLVAHRKLGPWVVYLLVAHAVALSFGYAHTTNALAEFWKILTTYEDALLAGLGLLLMIVGGVVSWRIVRRRISYEAWWMVHLAFYVAVLAATLHQFSNGAAFLGQPVAQALWIAAYVAVFGSILIFRVGVPIARNAKHQLRVAAVIPEAPGVVSVVVQGKQMDELPLAGGQFALWRFLTPATPKLSWQAHPYSVSGLRKGSQIRLTVKALGDHSATLRGLHRGTRVLLEGPYGVFTASGLPPGRRVALIAAGVGIAPLRSLLDDLPGDAAPILLYRVAKAEDILFADELSVALRARGGVAVPLVGSRHEQPMTAARLRELIPDIKARSIFLCGPSSFVDDVLEATRVLNVPPRQVHVEAFGFHKTDSEREKVHA